MKNELVKEITTNTKELRKDIGDFYEKHPYLTGHIIGCVLFYWIMVIASYATGKKWNLV